MSVLHTLLKLKVVNPQVGMKDVLLSVRSETRNLLHTLCVSSRSPFVLKSHSEEIAAQLDAVTDACGLLSNCSPVYICISSEHNNCKRRNWDPEKINKCARPHFVDEKAFRAICTEQ